MKRRCLKYELREELLDNNSYFKYMKMCFGLNCGTFRKNVECSGSLRNIAEYSGSIWKSAENSESLRNLMEGSGTVKSLGVPRLV